MSAVGGRAAVVVTSTGDCPFGTGAAGRALARSVDGLAWWLDQVGNSWAAVDGATELSSHTSLGNAATFLPWVKANGGDALGNGQDEESGGELHI